jgi:hypothetical protein
MGEQTPSSIETPTTPTQLAKTQHIWQTNASADNPNTTQTLEYTKDKYNAKMRK